MKQSPKSAAVTAMSWLQKGLAALLILCGVALLGTVAVAAFKGASPAKTAVMEQTSPRSLATITWADWSALSPAERSVQIALYAVNVADAELVPKGSRHRFAAFVQSCVDGASLQAQVSGVSFPDTLAICSAMFR